MSNSHTFLEACGLCDVATGVLWCASCGFAFCSPCSIDQHGRGKFRTHEPILLTSGTSTPSMINLKDSVCKSHPSEQLKFYCVDDKVPVCSYCVLTAAHKGHNAVSIETAAATTKLTLSQVTTKARQLLIDGRKLSEKTSVEAVSLETNCETVHRMITATFRDLEERLKNRRIVLEGQLKSLLASNFDEISQRKDQLERLLKTLETADTDCSAGLENDVALDIVVQGNIIQSLCAQIEAFDSSRKSTSPVIDFTFDQKIIDAASSFGTVVNRSASVPQSPLLRASSTRSLSGSGSGTSGTTPVMIGRIGKKMSVAAIGFSGTHTQQKVNGPSNLITPLGGVTVNRIQSDSDLNNNLSVDNNKQTRILCGRCGIRFNESSNNECACHFHSGLRGHFDRCKGCFSKGLLKNPVYSCCLYCDGCRPEGCDTGWHVPIGGLKNLQK